jgi:integrase
MLYEDLIGMFLEHSRQYKRSYRDDVGRSRVLSTHFIGRDMFALRAADIYAYIEKRRLEVSNSTINRELMLLSAAIGHARLKLEIELPNPVRGRLLPEPQGRVRWITKEQAEKLIACADSPCLADFIRLALNTGCRSSELGKLQWDRVDLERKILRLEAEHTKTARRRFVPLNSQAMAALRFRLAWRDVNCPGAEHVFLNAHCLRRVSFDKSFRLACQCAGITDFRIHDMRHTCAAWLVNSGVPLIVVRDLLGHASVTTTEIYAHLSPENVRSAVALLD